MWLMLQQDQPQDFVIATGTTITLEEFVESAFKQVNLNWKDHVIQDQGLFRPTDLAIGRADPSKAQKLLGWKASARGIEVVKKMYQSL
jgi:GDPmannose 4,6-dehydratase